MTEQKLPREMSDEELRDESKWDFENAEQLPPPERKARAIVSVAFPAADFDFVSEAARNAEMKLSHFIREAAIEKASTGAATLYLDAVPTETKTFGSVIVQSTEENMAVSA